MFILKTILGSEVHCDTHRRVGNYFSQLEHLSFDYQMSFELLLREVFLDYLITSKLVLIRAQFCSSF